LLQWMDFFLLWLKIFYCTYKTLFKKSIYSSLIPYLGDCDSCYDNHGSPDVSTTYWIPFLWITVHSEIVWSYDSQFSGIFDSPFSFA
jgi:hypothetical protein